MHNEALLSHFVAEAPTAVAMFDRDMRYLAASPRWLADHRLEAVPIGRSHYEDFLAIPGAWKEVHRRSLAGEVVRAERDCFERADGSRRWVRWVTQPWRRASGEIGGIVIFAEDITLYEREQEEMRQSEAALRALGDNLPDSTVFRFTRDADGSPRFLYISAGVERLLGVSVEVALADAGALFSRVLPDYLPQLAEAERISRRDLSVFEIDAPLRRADGEVRWVRLRSRPYRQTDGRIIWDGVQSDITDQIRQEAQRRDSERSKSYLLELTDALKPLRDPIEIIGAASRLLGLCLGAHQVAYSEIDAQQEFVTIRREWNEGSMPSNIGVHRLADFGPELADTLQRGQISVNDDVAAGPCADSDIAAATYRARRVGAFLSVPLVKAGRLAAALSVHQREPRPWSELDIALTEETAERTWAALERAQAEEAVRESEERLRFALAAADAGVWDWNLSTSAEIWSGELWRLYGLEPHSCTPSLDVWLQIVHPDDREAALRATREAAAEDRELKTEWRVRRPDGSLRWMMSRGAPVKRPDQPTRRFIGVTIDITERKASEEKISYLARHDALTGLPNRLNFNDRLDAAIAEADQAAGVVALLAIDLDRFKEINDVFGHAVGDELLRRVAERFLGAAAGAEIARVGGDEFAIIVSGKSARAQAGEMADRLIDSTAAPFDIDGRQMRISLSIGGAVYPDHGDREAVLANADAALYRAKAEGRDRICCFDSALDNKLRERHALLQNLEAAIGNGELLLHYQPQASAEGTIFGFEALIRWRHPRRGLVPPGEFIPVAEESGLIAEIGEWVLRESCREAASWPRPLSIAVNLSPVQFLKDGLPALVHAILLETGLPGHRLELEITEGVLVNDFSRVSAILRQLKTLGVRVAMDDFGTGYSSLSYVQSFPFDKIKIDRSFVSSLQNNASSQAIVRAIIGLGRGLGVPLIAEGVETQEQLRFLRAAGCEEAQGYLIGRPRPIEDYADIVGRPSRLQALA